MNTKILLFVHYAQYFTANLLILLCFLTVEMEAIEFIENIACLDSIQFDYQNHITEMKRQLSIKD